MKTAFPLRSLAVVGVLLFAAVGSAGTTLGRAQGAIFIGKPLDLRVQLQVDGDADALSGCVDADVYYGDTRVEPTRVSVKLESARGSQSAAHAIRVTSSVVVNEPLVTVQLRAGCQDKSSRRYVLFPEVSTHVVESLGRAPTVSAVDAAAAIAGNKTGSALATATVDSARPAAAPADRSKPKRMQSTTGVPARDAPQAVPSPTAALPQRPTPVLKSPGRSRLKLDPLDLVIERDPILHASSELLSTPQEDLGKRAEAAALWRALNASPEELMRDEVRAQRMEKDLKSLQAVTAENQKGLVDLASKVERTESQRYANGFVYALVALCLLSVLALGWLWRRLRAARAPGWMHGLEAGDSLLVELAQAPTVARTGTPGGDQPTAVPATAAARTLVEASAVARGTEPGPSSALDFDLDLMESPSHHPVQSPRAGTPVAEAAAQSRIRDFTVSVSGGLRAIDSEELLDVRQQADFFVSVGQHQRAIDILTTRIAQVGESSPLVCLDLLKIYHALGRQPEFEFIRAEFDNWFTGRVPEFQFFGDEGRSLDHYPLVMGRITTMWPGPAVLEYIENCLYHHSSEMDEPHFDLEAYRELLLLHGVAKRLVRLPDHDGDSHLSELLRVPARVQGATGAQPVRAPGSTDPAHRVGAQHRGAWKRSSAGVPDPQANVETGPVPLGGIKLPPNTQAPTPGDQRPPEPRPDNLTDFNFLGLQ